MKALYAGSFDPFTKGHKSIAGRALGIFGELIIAIGVNEKKKNEESAERRREVIRELFAGTPGVEVITYTGLTAQVAKEKGAGVLVRGVRTPFEFEKEKELADINMEVFGMPTVLIPANPGETYISSSMVRELRHFGHDISEFLPKK